ncbi:MAG: hypothetical protein KGJ54_10640 [Betaproteobacteria bacterium]|jgi:hypothetical protein|nr:hypothetical protein [Betaproteobacteria bacterium]OZB54812.1 MAG: hypothetical protein B7X43_02460 [Thiomonas sp. 15-63-373]
MIELLICAVLLLPLLPFSLAVNAALQALPNWLRALLLVALPVAGAVVLGGVPVPTGAMARVIQVVAALTALFYAWRLLSVRELFVWARLQATSAWALIWLAWLFGMSGERLIAVALALSLPAAVLTLLACALQRRLGGAYLGLRGRLGAIYPRLTGALVVALVAALAAPPFPGFFALLAVLHQVSALCVFTVLAVWILWSWAASMLWQHSLFGEPWPQPVGTADLSTTMAAVWVLLALAAISLGLIGGWVWSMH